MFFPQKREDGGGHQGFLLTNTSGAWSKERDSLEGGQESPRGPAYPWGRATGTQLQSQRVGGSVGPGRPPSRHPHRCQPVASRTSQSPPCSGSAPPLTLTARAHLTAATTGQARGVWISTLANSTCHPGWARAQVLGQT